MSDPEDRTVKCRKVHLLFSFSDYLILPVSTLLHNHDIKCKDLSKRRKSKKILKKRKKRKEGGREEGRKREKKGGERERRREG